jgi:hypothetical protein
MTGFEIPPIEYGHTGGNCSVTGGYRYRGSVYPEFVGQYIYGDYCSGRIWSARQSGSSWSSTEVINTPYLISAFGEDEAGELYVLHHGSPNGAVYRVDASPMHDDDGDGCSDVEENGTMPALGGDRDPLLPWDFTDVPVPAGPATGADGKPILTAASVRNKAVSLQDVGVVLAYVGRTNTDPPYTQDNNNDGLADGEQLDRTPSIVPGEPWHAGAPNTAISLQDVAVTLAQVSHTCVALP